MPVTVEVELDTVPFPVLGVLGHQDDELHLGIAPGRVARAMVDADVSRRVALAVRWSLAASWQARALILRGRDVQISIPLGMRESPRTRGMDSLPPLGLLIRPLFCLFAEQAGLRGFQRDGVGWLGRHERAILADDMGLGKTLQVLEAVRQEIYEGGLQTVVVLCPRALGSVWAFEARKWAPELTVASSSSWHDRPELLWELHRGRVHLLIVHYEALAALSDATMAQSRIQHLVLDEAHRVRRAEAALTGRVRALNPRRVWALTGTPIERDAEDLATILSVLDSTRFAPDMHQLGKNALRSLARPLMLRRRREDVLSELPPYVEVVHRLPLGQEQRNAYDARVRAVPRASRKNPGHLLTLVGDLLTICDAEPESGASAKLDDIVDRLVALGSRNEKSVVFSYRIHPLDLLMSRLEGRGVGCERLVGSMPLADRELALARFRTEERISVLCASSRVAAEGLTLTEANHVFFINRWWNPSNNDQARDRVVRIGQTRPVSVHAYLSEKTIEMNLERILATKRELVEDVVDALGKREIIPTEELAAALFEDLED